MAWKNSWPKIVAVCMIAPLALPLAFLSPTLRGISTTPLSDLVDCLTPLARTLIFSVSTTLVIIPLSFLGGILSWRWGARRLNWGGYWLVPLLGGGVVWACLWKLILFRQTWLQAALGSRNPLVFWSFFATIQIWQISPTFIFLYWGALNQVGHPKVRFAEPEGRSFQEMTRDVLWPQSRTMTQ